MRVVVGWPRSFHLTRRLLRNRYFCQPRKFMKISKAFHRVYTTFSGVSLNDVRWKAAWKNEYRSSLLPVYFIRVAGNSTNERTRKKESSLITRVLHIGAIFFYFSWYFRRIIGSLAIYETLNPVPNECSSHGITRNSVTSYFTFPLTLIASEYVNETRVVTSQYI